MFMIKITKVMRSGQMSVVVESSPADTRSIQAVALHSIHCIQVIDGLPPTDNLGTGQWHNLSLLRRLSVVHGLAPKRFPLALLTEP